MARTNWRIAGDYFETCNCNYLCPCIYTNMQAKPTHYTLLTMRVNDGKFGDIDLGGVGFIIAISVEGPMANGNWTVGLIIDEKASDVQIDAVGQICSGDVGGPMELAAALAGNFAGIERANIEIDKRAMSFSVTAGALFENTAVGTANAHNPNVPIFIDNTAHPANKRLALATGTKSHMHAFGIDWHDDQGGHNGHFAPFEWAAA